MDKTIKEGILYAKNSISVAMEQMEESGLINQDVEVYQLLEKAEYIMKQAYTKCVISN